MSNILAACALAVIIMIAMIAIRGIRGIYLWNKEVNQDERAKLRDWQYAEDLETEKRMNTMREYEARNQGREIQ